jgi:hypothetical protein
MNHARTSRDDRHEYPVFDISHDAARRARTALPLRANADDGTEARLAALSRSEYLL